MKQADIIKHGIIYRNLETPFQYHGWPSVCKLDDGALAAVWSGFRVAHVCPYGKTAMSISKDEGETWCPPMIVNDTALDDRDAGILNLRDGKLLITWFCHPKKWMIETALPESDYLPVERLALYEAYVGYYNTLTEEQGKGGSFVRTSADNGVTWGETILVPVSSPHGPTLLADGSILYLGIKLFTDEDKGDVAAYVSIDNGLTWGHRSTLQMPRDIPGDFFHEPHCVQLPSGRLLGALRVHGEDYFSVYLTHSDDMGKTWSVPKPLIPEGSVKKVCGSPPHLLVHSTGAVICSIGRREDPWGERVLVSHDEGKTWEEQILRDDSSTGDLGYPASVELSDGSVLTVYYQRAAQDITTSVLYTKWKL
ncbi:MAG: exo-alpha-sialidase [Clostridiales bacterium]|nr:exo-alpha-sialidase [Clostridiales bacterium]